MDYLITCSVIRDSRILACVYVCFQALSTLCRTKSICGKFNASWPASEVLCIYHMCYIN